jgi:membrane protein YqaA with SNARE-associated domain
MAGLPGLWSLLMTLADPTLLLYLEVAVVSFLVNVIPIFAPPTWIVLCLYQINNPALNGLGLAAFGVLGTVGGRCVMYFYSRVLGRFVPKKQAGNLNYLSQLAGQKKRIVIVGTFLYALSPLPSNFLFIASGISYMDVLPVLAGFALGRMISYASLAYLSYRIFFLAGGYGIWYGRYIVDFVGVAGALSMLVVDWEKTLQRLRRTFKVPALRTAPFRA